MGRPISDLHELLSNLEPSLSEELYVYCYLKDDSLLSSLSWTALYKEQEGLTVITSKNEALRHGLEATFECACITLRVHSDLAAVGLTAAVSSALADAHISCNVVAAYLHDHLFVPYKQRRAALSVLKKLKTLL